MRRHLLAAAMLFAVPTAPAADESPLPPLQVQASQPSRNDRRFTALGTDGFGRSDTRESLRTFFEVDRHFIVLAALKSLADEGRIERSRMQDAIDKYGIDTGKRDPAAAV